MTEGSYVEIGYAASTPVSDCSGCMETGGDVSSVRCS